MRFRRSNERRHCRRCAAPRYPILPLNCGAAGKSPADALFRGNLVHLDRRSLTFG